MAINDPRPITLRAEDLADDVPAQLFALADQLRNVRSESVDARDLLRRAIDRGDHRLRDRAFTRLVEHAESLGEVCEEFEVLTRSLRATGRL